MGWFIKNRANFFVPFVVFVISELKIDIFQDNKTYSDPDGHSKNIDE